MSGYALSAEAALDLEEIWTYIAQDSVTAADRWINKLFEAFILLAEMPGLGHSRSDWTPFPVLFWPLGAYLIVYRVQRERVEIAAVVHGARDVPMFLQNRRQ